MIKVVTPPASEPIDLATAKQQCRVDITDDDTYFTAFLIPAARQHIEAICWRALLTQTLDLYLDDWPAGPIYLTRSPVSAVASVKYTDWTGVQRTADPGTYVVDTVSEPGRIMLQRGQFWPTYILQSINAIVVRFTAGWTAATDVSRPLIQAMLLLIGYWYANREAAELGQVSPDIDLAVRSLIDNERARRF